MSAAHETTQALATHLRGMADNAGDQIDADRLSRAADLVEAPQAVRVKGLVWNGFVSANYRIEVEKGGIANLWYYSAAMVEDEEPTMMKGGYLTLVSMDDLKAAAQSDYDARILAALEPAPEAAIHRMDAAQARAEQAEAALATAHVAGMLEAAEIAGQTSNFAKTQIKTAAALKGGAA